MHTLAAAQSDPDGFGDFKGLRHLAEQTGKRFLRGILLYAGSASVAFGPNLHAVPVGALWLLDAELGKP